MKTNKPEYFTILGQEAVYFNDRIEVYVPDEDVGSKILIKLANAILDKKIKSLRINLPNKIIFVSAHDNQQLLIRAEECNDKKVMN